MICNAQESPHWSAVRSEPPSVQQLRPRRAADKCLQGVLGVRERLHDLIHGSCVVVGTRSSVHAVGAASACLVGCSCWRVRAYGAVQASATLRQVALDACRDRLEREGEWLCTAPFFLPGCFKAGRDVIAQASSLVLVITAGNTFIRRTYSIISGICAIGSQSSLCRTDHIEAVLPIRLFLKDASALF
jgi:hypothetical protein